jgi:gliding motility-associated-like protein
MLAAKTWYYFVFLSLISFISTSQNTFVPDDNFEQALIDLGYDSLPLNNFVPTANISGLTTLDVSAKNISDLTGIEDFINLSVLNCSNNQLTVLNISQNTKLTELYCNNNFISVLDVSALLDLKIFWCNFNQLTAINTNNNTKLISLVCGNNLLTSLGIQNNTLLTVLAFEDNYLSTIDVSKNTRLSRLQCGSNILTVIDISKNLNLSYLSCEENELTALDTSNNIDLRTLICFFNKISILDESKNKSLIELDCSNNDLCLLNLKNGNNSNLVANFQTNTNLNCVITDNPSLTHSNWMPNNFLNYVSSENECVALINVDKLDNVISYNSFTLPNITNGNYFTESEGTGTPLFTGDIITASQIIYIYNKTTCFSNETFFNVLITNEDYIIPKYFTPNNDGTHDYWQVLDNTNTIKIINIYNRYGKLLKSLPPNSIGWNGTFKGKLLETDDYWYTITFNSGEILKGHFALKK